MYTVLTRFRDLQTGILYEAGEEFPRSGTEVSAERIAFLSGNETVIGEPFIKEVVPKKTRKKKGD